MQLIYEKEGDIYTINFDVHASLKLINLLAKIKKHKITLINIKK